MHKSIERGLYLLLATLTFSPVANAESWICEYSNMIREINVVRETAAQAPCAVAYNKQSEGLGTQVLWTASNDGSYCDVKANGLAQKLEGLGWTCTAF
jgi:hypothetical protein